MQVDQMMDGRYSRSRGENLIFQEWEANASLAVTSVGSLSCFDFDTRLVSKVGHGYVIRTPRFIP